MHPPPKEWLVLCLNWIKHFRGKKEEDFPLKPCALANPRSGGFRRGNSRHLVIFYPLLWGGFHWWLGCGFLWWFSLLLGNSQCWFPHFPLSLVCFAFSPPHSFFVFHYHYHSHQCQCHCQCWFLLFCFCHSSTRQGTACCRRNEEIKEERGEMQRGTFKVFLPVLLKCQALDYCTAAKEPIASKRAITNNVESRCSFNTCED